MTSKKKAKHENPAKSSSSQPANQQVGSNESSSAAWTRNHHLIGNEILRTAIVPSEGRYQKVRSTLHAQYFQPEDARLRKPALWRALYTEHGGEDTPTAVAFDVVSAEWQQQQSTDESSDLLNVSKERIQGLLYKTVVEEWIPSLVLAAVLEEVQAALANQIIREQQQQGSAPSGESSKGKKGSATFPYYSQSPSIYLESSTFKSTSNSHNSSSAALEDSAASTLLRIRMTPAQLVARIKQGCGVLWQRQTPTSLQSNATTRSSRRLAQQQTPVDEIQQEESTDEMWKVVPGGKVATFLQQNLLQQKYRKHVSKQSANQETKSPAAKHEEKENGSQGGGRIEDEDLEEEDAGEKDEDYNANEQDDVEEEELPESIDSEDKELDHMAEEQVEVVMEESSDHEPDDFDFLFTNNPYVNLEPSTILEWLGRKTSKLLSSSDLQEAILELIAQPVQNQKKKRMNEYRTIPETHPEIVDLLPASFWRYISRLHEYTANDDDWQGAKLSLSYQDEAATDDMQFGRCPLNVRVWWAPAVAKSRIERAEAETASIQNDAKNARAWGTWRYRGIHEGYTVWPSWLEAAAKWQEEQAEKTNGALLSLGNANTENQVQQATTASDEQLAMEIEADTTTRRSRRSEKGKIVGVFYGTQSNMTPKQVMEAVLRLVSQSSIRTLASLVAAVPDESIDPLRRIRTALGKLVYKRRQLCKLSAQSTLSDSGTLDLLAQKPLLTFDKEISPVACDGVDENEVAELVDYISSLHKTELHIRDMVMKHLSDFPINLIATAADERIGSMESMDSIDFEPENIQSVAWQTSGHESIGSIIFRPIIPSQTETFEPCVWMRIVDFADSIASNPTEEESALDRPKIGVAKESKSVQRRCRFRALPIAEAEQELIQDMIILTEAQVHAGLKAANIERNKETFDHGDAALKTNPFTGSKTMEVSLIAPPDSDKPDFSGTIVAHDSKFDSEGVVKHRVLVIPSTEGTHGVDVEWINLIASSSGTIEGVLDNDPDCLTYTLQQFEYHIGSRAHEECRAVVQFLQRHTKSGPFLTPVDPVALKIPQYFTIVKNPMDISTLSKNLEAGMYSTIPPKQSKGRSAISRMLNGPFRKDLDLIFDNAMLFNPPDDWIFQEAAALKKAVSRKIDSIISSSENNGRYGEKPSIYEEYESDADMYEYESDQDDEYLSSGKSRRKRKRSPSSAHKAIKEDASARLIERPLKLQKMFGDQGLRGPLSHMPVSTDASLFSLPSGWLCRRRQVLASEGSVTSANVEAENTELHDILTLHRALEEQEVPSLRRSTRAVQDVGHDSPNEKAPAVEFYRIKSPFPPGQQSLPQTRNEVEFACEQDHETRYARLYYKLANSAKTESRAGFFAEGSFPPYLGRVVPTVGNGRLWEIRSPYLTAALRWVLRGLIQSEHIHEYETVETSKDSGSIIPNHVYYIDQNVEPFEVVDSKELTRQKRANDATANESSDEEVELSAYEKERADRVARNAARLKALGLA